MSTTRPRASDALLQFRAIVDNIPALIAFHNASGELELENRAAQEYHGRSRWPAWYIPTTCRRSSPHSSER